MSSIIEGYNYDIFISYRQKDNKGEKWVTEFVRTLKIELDNDDLRFFENETGSPLRSLDFIFLTSAGVNRPLRINEERPSDNLNKTLYRDQINKVANAIKELILALKTDNHISGTVKALNHRSDLSLLNVYSNSVKEKYPRKNRLKHILLPLALVITLAVSAFIVYHRSSRISTLQNLVSSDGRLSVAVMPLLIK
jgi:hypothetical protein